MGGRGMSGATYNKKIKLARQLAKVNKQVAATEDKIMKTTRYVGARPIKGKVKRGRESGNNISVKQATKNFSKFLQKEGVITDTFNDYKKLKVKQKNIKDELHTLNQGQRAMWS